MHNAKRVVLIAMVICVGLASLCSAGSDVMEQYRARKGIKESTVQNKGRMLHFPSDRSLGKLLMQDVGVKRQIKTFHHWIDGAEWEYLGQAKGDVLVPADKRLALRVPRSALSDLSSLSELGPNDLYELSLGYTSADDTALPYISHLTGLRVLSLASTNITSKGMRYIKDMQCLERLALPSRITNSGLVIVGKLKSLKGLYFEENRVTNKGLTRLTNLTSLEELQLCGSRIDDEGLAHLAKLPSLRYLLLDDAENFTDAGMAYLKDIDSLRILRILGLKKITDAGVKHLSEHPGLERITFHWNENITNRGAKYLATMRSLKMLDVKSSQITDAGLAHLAKAKTLEHLGLPREGITNRGLVYLGKLPNLKYLNISKPHYADPDMDKRDYNDNGLKELANLHLLEVLRIGGLGVTDTGMSHIAKLTNLKYLGLFGCPITDQGLAELTALKSLEKLYINYPKNVTISGISNLNGMDNLTNLEVGDIVQDNSVLDLSGLTKLENLELATPRRPGTVICDTSIHDQDLACLAKLKKLKYIQISGLIEKGTKGITDVGMTHLVELTNLEQLAIGGPDLTDEAINHLKNMKKLYSLSIFATGLTDKGLRHLEDLPALTHLDIRRRHNFSDAALLRLKTKFPDLRINIRP